MRRLVLTLALGLSAPAAAVAQGYPATAYDGRMNQMLRQNDALTQQLNQFQAQTTTSAMRDPQIQAAYNWYRANGGTQDFPSWAFNYRATGGYTPEGMAAYRQNEMRNTANEQAAWLRLQQAQQESLQAMQQQQGSFYGNHYQSGMQLDGWTYYTRPSNGTTYWYRQ